MSGKVFLSYTASDLQRARYFAELLTRHGFQAWFADADLSPGERLTDVVEQLRSVNYVILLLSRAAVNSKWVCYEMDTALSMQLANHPITLVPVFLEPDVPRPDKVAAFVSVDFSRETDDVNVQKLLAILTGERTPPDRYIAFRNFIERLVQLDTRTCETISDVAGFATDADSETRERIQATIQQKLQAAAVDETQRERILAAVASGITPPIIDRKMYPSVQTWLRQTGGSELVDLAASFWLSKWQGLRGITVRWVEDYLKDLQPNHHESADHAFIEYRAERLIVRAQQAGLLLASTEWNDPRTYAYQDAQENPGYDFGPMVSMIGRFAAAFQEAAKRDRT